MRFAPYRRVLALRGVTSLLALSTFGRMPVIAGSMVLTLYVVLEQQRGYGAAGVVFAATILGSAVGQPLLGRLTDRYGLRPVVVFGTLVGAGFWAGASYLSYPMLLVAGFAASVIRVPVFTVSRQAFAALVPPEHRRAAYSLDSIAVELSYMAGPSLGVLVVTQWSAQAGIWAVGAGVVASGVLFYLVDPPLRGESETTAAPVPVRRWMRTGIVAVLLTVAGATLVLSATEVVVIAALRESGDLAWASVVLIAWGVYSIAGGLVYGGLRTAPGPGVLMLLLGGCTALLGLADGWLWLTLALIPAGVLCAPTLAGATDVMSRLAPPAVRGEAMGYHASASNVGMAVGTPLAGSAIDLVGPTWGVVVAGAVGASVAVLALLIGRWDRAAAGEPPEPGTAVAGPVRPAGTEGALATPGQ